MGLSFKVTYPESLTGGGKIDEIERQKTAILEEAGTSLYELICDWMRQLNQSRSPRSGHFDATPDNVLDPVVDGDSVHVSITIPGITRALHDIVIRPVEAKALAIPVHADAFGMSPREYNQRFPKGSPEALFHPKGKDWLAKRDGKGLAVMYYLTDIVHQSQDRSLLPPDEDLNKAITDGVVNAIEAILES